MDKHVKDKDTPRSSESSQGLLLKKLAGPSGQPGLSELPDLSEHLESSQQPGTSEQPGFMRQPLARRTSVHVISSNSSLLSKIVFEELEESDELEDLSGSDLKDLNYEPESDSESSGDEVNNLKQSNACDCSQKKLVPISQNDGTPHLFGGGDCFVHNNVTLNVENVLINSDTQHNINQQPLHNCVWHQVQSYHTCSSFADYSKESKFNFNLENPKPVDTFFYFITEEMLESMVAETNGYAKQYKSTIKERAKARSLAWTKTTVTEMKQFLGIMIIMGLVPLPSIDKYWAKDNIFGVKIIKETMSRDRFLLLKKFWHFSDNESNPDPTDRLSKIKTVVDSLNVQFASSLTPARDLIIDETVIPWRGSRGRLFLRQYIPNKSRKYGIKLYKLCTTEGYTIKVLVCTGKSTKKTSTGHTHDVVIHLAGAIHDGDTRIHPGFLDSGRHLYADSLHTSISLAETLMNRNTRLCGRIRSNRKGIPAEVIIDVNKGDTAGVECQHGTKLVRCKDKRVVTMITTMPQHDKLLMDTGKKNIKNLPVLNPQCVLSYNMAKKAVDIGDQLASYYCCLSKTLKWYRKIVLELITGTAMVNSWFAYQTMAGNRMPLIKYRETLARALMKAEGIATTPHRKRTHSLRKMDGHARKTRRRCSVCYQKNRATLTVQEASRSTKQVTTYCEDCTKKPFMCLDCFNMVHT